MSPVPKFCQVRHLSLDKVRPNSKFSLQAFEAYSRSCKCLIHTIPWSFSNKSYIFFFLKIGRRTNFNSSPALQEYLNVYLFEVNRFPPTKAKTADIISIEESWLTRLVHLRVLDILCDRKGGKRKRILNLTNVDRQDKLTWWRFLWKTTVSLLPYFWISP